MKHIFLVLTVTVVITCLVYTIFFCPFSVNAQLGKGTAEVFQLPVASPLANMTFVLKDCNMSFPFGDSELRFTGENVEVSMKVITSSENVTSGTVYFEAKNICLTSNSSSLNGQLDSASVDVSFTYIGNGSYVYETLGKLDTSIYNIIQNVISNIP
jgi:hypothetical protein